MASRKKVIASAEQLLAGPRDRVEVVIPELSSLEGGDYVVLLRYPSVGAVIRFFEEQTSSKSGLDPVLKLLAETIVDESGKLSFTIEQAAQIGDLDMRIFVAISKAVIDLANSMPGVVKKDGDAAASATTAVATVPKSASNEAAAEGNGSSETSSSGSPIVSPSQLESGTLSTG